MHIFLVIALFIVAGGLATAVAAWMLERSDRIEPSLGDKLLLVGLAAAVAGLPLLAMALIYAFG